jgi:hypothetical protein
MTDEEIEKWCERFKITNYTINNGLVDTEEEVMLSFWKIKMPELPIRFGTVNGDFDCANMGLTTLKGSPHTVSKGFFCHDNKLTSLEHCPVNVGGIFNCADNDITNVDYYPESIGGGTFYIGNNPIAMIFNVVNQDFLHAFNSYKVLKDNEVNLKRLRYVMNLFDKRVNIAGIKKHYKII